MVRAELLIEGEQGFWPEIIRATADLMRAAIDNPLGIIALALVGVVAWILAVRSRKDESPAWSTHALGLVALLALPGGAMQIHFHSQDLKSRDARIQELETDLTADRKRLAKPYGMTFKLLFPEGRLYDPFSPDIEVFLKRPEELAPKQLGGDRFQENRGVGGISVVVPELGAGDKVYIQLREKQERTGRTWRSDDVLLPEAHLTMHPLS